jgi:anti-sigma B factor antagonist
MRVDREPFIDNGQPASFEVRVVPTGEAAVRVEVVGELDLATAPSLRQVLDGEIRESRHVVLDLSRITFIDSTGLKAILSAKRASEENGGGFHLSPALPSHARRLIEITRLEDVLPVERI